MLPLDDDLSETWIGKFDVMSVRRSRRKSLLSVDVREFNCDDFTSEDDMSTSARTCGTPCLKDEFSVAGVRMLEPENPLSCHQLSFNRHWTAEEDEKLMAWVQCNGATGWTLASQQFLCRTPRECRDRWKLHLNPERKRKLPWTDEEDVLLHQLHPVYGGRWAEYARHLPGRTDQDIRSHWNLIQQSHELAYNRPVTPSLSSDSFYQRIEPVKLFGTPKTPPKSCIKEEYVGSGSSTRNFESKSPTDAGTPMSLEIGSFLSPSDHLLLSPTNLWTPEGTVGTPETAAFLSDLEALLLLQSSDGDVSIPRDLNSCFLETPPNVKRFTGLRSKCLGDPRAHSSVSSSGDSILAKLTNRQAMACHLKFEMPCILRKRKIRSPGANRRIDERFGCSEYKDYHHLTTSESSPKNEAPFTPSRFLNSPHVVTSTPVAKADRLTPPQPLYSCLCSPPVKRLLVDEFAQTLTPFKSRERSFIDVLMPEDVDDVDVGEGIDFLPFSSYSTLDDLTDRDPILKTEAVNRDVAGCQMTLTKSLDKPWSCSGAGNPFVESLISLETPSKSLINDESLMFSPPSIIRDTLHESLTFDQTTPSSRAGPLLKAIKPSISQTKVGWERVACGQTLTQMELVKQAKELLDESKLYICPRSLQL